MGADLAKGRFVYDSYYLMKVNRALDYTSLKDKDMMSFKRNLLCFG